MNFLWGGGFTKIAWQFTYCWAIYQSNRLFEELLGHIPITCMQRSYFGRLTASFSLYQFHKSAHPLTIDFINILTPMYGLVWICVDYGTSSWWYLVDYVL